MHDDNRPRRVVPRWRPSWVTAVSVESKSLNKPSNLSEVGREAALQVAMKRRELERLSSVPIASELMFLAQSSGDHDAAQEAARIILRHEQQIGSTQLILSAKKVLDSSDISAEEVAPRDFVRNARKLLSIDYNNPILHTDIALALTAKRQDKAAEKYIRTAINLAPNSRFVTRAAARYFLHIGELDVAHDILKRSPLYKSDPWVQASEIAVATLRGRSSGILKQTIRKFDIQLAHQCTELVSAVGTVELISGSKKRARQLFIESLRLPNDNSVAQAEWAATKLKIVVDSHALQVPHSFEANSHNAYRRQDIEAAINFAASWSADEPFASRPIEDQCYFFSLAERYEEAKDRATILVMHQRNNLPATLNLMFSQTQTGEIEKARREFERVSNHPDLNSFYTHYLANGGAISYAMGDFEMARGFYSAAIKVARAKSEPHSEALARAFFARMAAKAGDPNAGAILKEALDIVPRLPSAGAIYVIKDLADPSKKAALMKVTDNRVAERTWQWDKDTNTLKLIG